MQWDFLYWQNDICIIKMVIVQFPMSGSQFSTKIMSYCGKSCIDMLKTLYENIHRNLGADSIQRCRLTSIGNPIVEIRRSKDRLISTMGFPILVRWCLCLYIESGPWDHVLFQYKDTALPVYKIPLCRLLWDHLISAIEYSMLVKKNESFENCFLNSQNWNSPATKGPF